MRSRQLNLEAALPAGLGKPALRALLREGRRAFVAGLGPGERAALERGLAEQLRPHVPESALVGAYAAVGDEIDVSGFAPFAALPWFADRSSPMRFRLGGAAEKGPFGVPQPPPWGLAVEPAVLLVPLLAAAPDGTRLGQGAGHYDRWLSGAPGRDGLLVIGCAWDMQIVPALPRDAWDAPLDAIATPTRFVRCR